MGVLDNISFNLVSGYTYDGEKIVIDPPHAYGGMTFNRDNWNAGDTVTIKLRLNIGAGHYGFSINTYNPSSNIKSLNGEFVPNSSGTALLSRINTWDKYSISDTITFVNPTSSAASLAIDMMIVNRSDYSSTNNGAGEIYIDEVIINGKAVTNDPYAKGGISVSGGGTGTFSSSSDLIPLPSLPTLNAVDVGLLTLFAPTIGEMKNLTDYLWSPAFSVETFKKLFANPMDVILGLSIVPIEVPKDGTKEITISGVATGISMQKAASQYVHISCGSIKIDEYWGSALDYSPYTKCTIYLPYIGSREIKIDDIMGKTVSVDYNIDVLSGSLCAMILVDGSVYYSFAGACATNIPITASSWDSLVSSILQLVGVGIVASAGGIGAGLAAEEAGASFESSIQVTSDAIASNIKDNANGAVTNTARTLSALKPSIQRSGAVSGSAGMLGVQTPYIIIERPRQSLAENYNRYVGYPCNMTLKLSDVSGYTIIENIHLDNISATSIEKVEIENLLKSGVIL